MDKVTFILFLLTFVYFSVLIVSLGLVLPSNPTQRQRLGTTTPHSRSHPPCATADRVHMSLQRPNTSLLGKKPLRLAGAAASARPAAAAVPVPAYSAGSFAVSTNVNATARSSAASTVTSAAGSRAYFIPAATINAPAASDVNLSEGEKSISALTQQAAASATASATDDFDNAIKCTTCNESFNKVNRPKYSVCCGSVRCQKCTGYVTSDVPCSTPGCPGVLTRTSWSDDTFDKQRFQTDVSVRTRLAPAFCLRREHFATAAEYCEYEELQQDIIYDLVYGDTALRRTAEERFNRYKRAYSTQIMHAKEAAARASAASATAADAAAAAVAAAAAAAVAASGPPREAVVYFPRDRSIPAIASLPAAEVADASDASAAGAAAAVAAGAGVVGTTAALRGANPATLPPAALAALVKTRAAASGQCERRTVSDRAEAAEGLLIF